MRISSFAAWVLPVALLAGCSTPADSTAAPDAPAPASVADAPAAAGAAAADPMHCARMGANEPRPADCAYPPDVLAFLDMRANCEHWLGEPDFSEDRRREIASAVEETCTGLDTQLEALKLAHAGDPATRELLGALEPLGMP